MVDRDPKDLEPYLLTTEYWKGHEPEDNCLPGEKSNLYSLRQGLKIRKFVKPLLEDFLSVSDVMPLRTFGEGEHFLPNQFPEGTIVEFTLEKLRFGPGYFGLTLPPYSIDQMLGVVYGYDGKRGREIAIMSFYKDHIKDNMQMNLPPFFGVLGDSHSLPVIIGDISHVKERGRKNRDSLERITGLTVHQIGKGAPQETRRSLTIPRLGTVFRPQHGNA